MVRICRRAACPRCLQCPPWACPTCPRLSCPQQQRACSRPCLPPGPRQEACKSFAIAFLAVSGDQSQDALWHSLRLTLPKSVWTHHKGCTLKPQRLSGTAVGNKSKLLSFTRLLTCKLTVQGPSAAAAYEAAQPYSAFYKLLPVLSGTGVGRKLQQGGPQQQPGPQQPAAGVHPMNPTCRSNSERSTLAVAAGRAPAARRCVLLSRRGRAA